jgi:spermidine synthase
VSSLPLPTSAPLGRVLPLVFASGACALVYQVAWTRDFRLVFGASTPASAAVVAIFVGGLGLGAWRIGSRIDRSDRPLRLYAWLELGVAASSAVTPLLVALATRVYVALGGTVVLGAAGATVARLLLAALVLATPTFLMGGTLPALARAAVARGGDPGRRGVALLYGVNTLGAVVGCLGANFALLERLGTHGSLWLAAGVNAVVALAAGLMARRLAGAPALPPEAPAEPEPGDAAAPPAFVLAAAAVVGFAFFLMELVFYRMLVPLLGGTVYTFGLVLAVALFGIGAGASLDSALFARRAARLSGFATVCLLEAAGLALPYALGDRLAVLAVRLRPVGAQSLDAYLPGWLAVTGIVVLPASIAAGVQFPMLVALLGRGRPEVARHVGLAYAWNTVGAIAGALAGGFGLMPLLTAPGCWRTVSEVLAAAGLSAATLAWRRERRWVPLGVQLALATAVVLVAHGTTGPTAGWRHSPIGAGRVEPRAVDSPAAASKYLRDVRRNVAWQTDGIESSVALMHNLGYSFSVNAKIDGHCRYDAGTQVMGGLLGALLHPDPRSAMVIGLGSGSTAGWLASVPSVERVDAVELEPAMLEIARRCAPINAGALDDPKLHVVLGDAREVLAVTRSRYDVVFSEPSNPYRAGVASLYTREYYQRVVEHLGDGGLFLQWVQAYEIDARTMRTILATVASVFPHVEVWELEYPDLVLVASRTPIPKDAPALRARVASEPFARALRGAWGVEDLEGVLAHFVANASFARGIQSRGMEELNTDDRSVVEFGFARTVGAGGSERDMMGVYEVADWARRRGEDRPDVGGGTVDWERVGLLRSEIPSVDGERVPPPPPGASDDVVERLDFLRQTGKEAIAAWDKRLRAPASRVEALHLAEAGVDAQDPRAEEWVQQLEATQPLEALALRARLLEDEKRYGEAADAVERALVGYRSDPWPWPLVMNGAIRVAERIGRQDRALAPRMLEALSQPFALEMERDPRLEAAAEVAPTVDPVRGCVEVLAPMEPDTPWSERVLKYRAECYRAVGDGRAAKAEAELARFRSEASEGR